MPYVSHLPPSDHLTNKQALALLADGDANAVITAHLDLIKRVVWDRYDAHPDAEEMESIATTALVQAANAAANNLSIVGMLTVTSYLRRRMDRAIKAWLDKERRRKKHHEREVTELDLAPERVDLAALREIMDKVLAEFPAEWRMDAVIAALQHQRPPEIAADLGVPLSTLRDRITAFQRAARKYL